MIDLAAAWMAAGHYDPLNDQINRIRQAETNAMNAAMSRLNQGFNSFESASDLRQRSAAQDLHRQAYRDQAVRGIGYVTDAPPVPQPEPMLNPVLLLLE